MRLMTKLFNKERYDAIYNTYCVYNPTKVYNIFGRSKETGKYLALCKKRKQREDLKKEEALTPERGRILELLREVLRTLPCSGYSMGEVKEVMLNRGDYCVSMDFRNYYSKSCKWSPTHGHIRVILSPKDLLKTRVIGGLPTRLLDAYSKSIRKCEWIEWEKKTNRGKVTSVSPKWVKGYLVDEFHALSLEEARRQVQRMKETQRLLSEELRISTKIEKLTLKKAEKMKISVEDSIASGNCRPGTTEFIVRYDLLERDFISGKELIEISRWAKGYYNYFIARIFAYKVIGRSPYNNEVKKVQEILF